MSGQKNRSQIRDYLKNQFSLPAEQVDEMIPGFINTLAGHLANLEAAALSGDPQQVGKAGHTIKGALLNLGLHHCADIAHAIERKGKAAEGGEELDGLVVSLRKELDFYLD